MAKQLLGNLKELFSPFFALKDHAHGLITKDGVISGQASKNVVTDSSGKITTEAKPTIPSANDTSTNIKMNGTQSAGSLASFAKADHVHPVDTSRAAASHTHHDNSITWDSSAVGTVTSLDLAVNNQVNANRLNFLPSANISISYSTNNSTYTDYGATNDQKIGLVTDTYDWQGIAFASGKGATASANNTLRVEINAGGVSGSQDSNLYCSIKKCMIAFSTAGATNCKVLVEKRIYGETTYSTVGTFNLDGYWGWNSFSLNNLFFGAYKSQMTSSDAHAQYLRFTFSSNGNANFQLKGIRFYGDRCWVAPSQYAKDSQLGAIGRGQDITFPAKIIKRGGTNTQLLLANGDTKPTTDFAVTEYIVGTHGTTATPTWTGTSTKISSLRRGQVIYFKMTSAGTSAGNTLNLTLANGTPTGAKNIYYHATTRLTTHFPINTILELVYDGTNWLCTAIQNTNNFDRLINGSNITAGEALTANTLVYARSNGRYYKVASGGTLDIRYPVIYNNQAIESGNNHWNNHNAYHAGVNIQNTLSGKTITAYQNCYLEGMLAGNTFTISSNVFVSDGATVKGKYYILLGMAFSTTLIRFNSFDKTVYKCIDNNHTLIPFTNMKGVITTGSLDDVTMTGWYSYSGTDSNNITNVPEKVGSVMEVLDDYGDGNYAVQKVYPLRSDKLQIIYYRVKYSANGWSSWQRIDGGDKAPTSHTHDDRYFTESEINTKFGWTTVATTSLGGGTQKLDVNSTLRLANYYGNASVAVTTNVVQLGTLTNGYFPSKTVRQPAHNLTANPIWIIVTNDGKISYRGSTASNGNLTLDWNMFWRY